MSPEPTQRRRRRASAPQGEPPRPAAPAAPKASDRQAPARRNQQRRTGTDDLAGSGGSQVSVSAALRARAVNRPTDDDLADAARGVEIVRRNWNPPPG